MKISINLLSQRQKVLLKKQYAFFTVLEQVLYIVIVGLLFLAALMSIVMILKSNLTGINSINASAIERIEYKEVLAMHDVFQETNHKIDVINGIQKKHITWEGLLILFGNNVPQEIEIGKIDISNRTFAVVGSAQTRETLVAFKGSMEKLSMGDTVCFSDVVIPPNDLLNPDLFHMSADISLGCIQQNV